MRVAVSKRAGAKVAKQPTPEMRCWAVSAPNYSQREKSWCNGWMQNPSFNPADFPEFLRLPRPGERCKLTGLSRTTLCELIDAGHVKAKKLRRRGSLRGITLIPKASLLEYLHGLEDAV